MTDELEKLRRQIDIIDEQLLEILAKRIAIIKEIGKYKKANKIPALDNKRWQEVLRTKTLKADVLHLPKAFVIKIYNAIHEYALEIEDNT